MKLAALVCAALLAGLRPTPADACSCMSPTVRAAIEKTAPINTHVMLWIPSREDRTTPAFTLRPAGSTSALALERHDVKAGELTIARLVPKQVLRPKTAYEVVDDQGDKVLEFTTTGDKDTKAPGWTGLKEADHVKQPGRCCMCNTGAPHIRVRTGELSDDQDRDAVAFAVWTAAAGKAIDYKLPPTTYVQTWQGRFWLGRPSMCVPNNFDLPTGKVRIGVRPVDLAGNLGTASERELDLSKQPKAIPDNERL